MIAKPDNIAPTDQIVWQSGEPIEYRCGERWYFPDWTENTHRKLQPDKEQLGYGVCGVCWQEGSEAVKSNHARGKKTIEGEVYAAMCGKEGISSGYEKDNEIRTPVYPNIISIYVIRDGQRPLFAPLIEKNLSRIRKALAALSNAGFYYGDSLQFGVCGQNLFLLDFSAAKKTSARAAAMANKSRLDQLLEDFYMGNQKPKTISRGCGCRSKRARP